MSVEEILFWLVSLIGPLCLIALILFIDRRTPT
jgi:hypothetical protein